MRFARIALSSSTTRSDLHMKARITRRELRLLLTLSPLLGLVACGGAPDSSGTSPGTVLLATTVSSGPTAPVLDQASNPVYALLNNYTSWRSKSADPVA